MWVSLRSKVFAIVTVALLAIVIVVLSGLTHDTGTRVLVAAAAGAVLVAFSLLVTRAFERRFAEVTRRAEAADQANVRLQHQAAQLAQASAYKSQFLASMSHELRTPLNAIIGFSELMYDGIVPLEPAQMQEYLGDILTSGRHLLQLINDMLDLSKIEAGRLELVPAPVQLTHLFQEVVAGLRPSIARYQVRVETTVADHADSLVIDPARLKQVLYNYLSNALKFTGEGGNVMLRATGEGDHVRIEVEDTGTGIAADDVKRLFADDQQTAAGARVGGSMGLGLALTRRLVETLGGSVGVASEPGVGSTFHAVFPRAPGHADAMPAIAHSVPKPLHDRAIVGSLLRAGVRPGSIGSIVLVVDDDLASLKVMAATLQQLGYTAVCEADSRRALRLATEEPPSAIVLDLVMPEMTGFEVLSELRRHPRTRDVPVIIWSSKDLDTAELARLRGAAHAVISKGHEGNARVVEALAAVLPRRRTVEVADGR